MSQKDLSAGAPELPPDLAELGAIAQAQDAAIDGASLVPGAPAATAEPEVDRASELGAMLGLGVAMVAPALPFMPHAYTPDVCQQIGAAVDAVATKYGWNLEGLQSPELALAAVSIPPTIAAVVMGRQYFAARREAEERAAKQGRVTSATPDGTPPAGAAHSHQGAVLQPGAIA